MKMGGLVEEAIMNAAISLDTRDEELAEKVRAGDRVIDDLEEQIDQKPRVPLPCARPPPSTCA